MDEKEKICKEFIDLYLVVKRVREECPWDQKQTSQTLVPYFLEESYEPHLMPWKKTIQR